MQIETQQQMITTITNNITSMVIVTKSDNCHYPLYEEVIKERALSASPSKKFNS